MDRVEHMNEKIDYININKEIDQLYKKTEWECARIGFKRFLIDCLPYIIAFILLGFLCKVF